MELERELNNPLNPSEISKLSKHHSDDGHGDI